MAYIAQLKQQNSERCYYCWQHIAIMSTCVTALPDDGCQWSKRLFLSALHLRVHARDDGRLEEAAAQLVPSSTGDHLPTLRHRIFHMLFHLPQDMYTAAQKLYPAGQKCKFLNNQGGILEPEFTIYILQRSRYDSDFLMKLFWFSLKSQLFIYFVSQFQY